MSAFLRRLGLCLGLCSGAVLTAAGLTMFGLWIAAVFAAVGWGFAGLGLAQGVLPEYDRRAGWAAFLGLFTVATAGLVAMTQQQYRLVGLAADQIGVDAAPAQAFANRFTFTDGRVLPELEGSAEYTGRYGTPLGRVYAAPVVPAGWRPGQPVRVWAVADDDTYAADSAQWAQPARVGVRVASFMDDDYRRAVQQAEQANGLAPAEPALLIRWTADPAAELRAAWLKLALIAAGSTGVWLAGLLVLRIWPR